MSAPARRVVYGPRIGPLDFALVYAIPVLVLVALWLLLSLAVLILVHSRLESDFKADVIRRYTLKKRMGTSLDLKLSYGFIARLLLGDNSLWATLLYRVSRVLVRHRLYPVAQLVHTFAKALTGADLNPKAEIGPGFYLYHGIGTVIGRGTHLGRNALVCQGVTIGDGRVRIGDDVTIWSGAKVIGNVSVGHRSAIGANAVVLTDIPADVTAVGVPATRLIPKTPRQSG